MLIEFTHHSPPQYMIETYKNAPPLDRITTSHYFFKDDKDWSQWMSFSVSDIGGQNCFRANWYRRYDTFGGWVLVHTEVSDDVALSDNS